MWENLSIIISTSSQTSEKKLFQFHLTISLGEQNVLFENIILYFLFGRAASIKGVGAGPVSTKSFRTHGCEIFQFIWVWNLSIHMGGKSRLLKYISFGFLELHRINFLSRHKKTQLLWSLGSFPLTMTTISKTSIFILLSSLYLHCFSIPKYLLVETGGSQKGQKMSQPHASEDCKQNNYDDDKNE